MDLPSHDASLRAVVVKGPEEFAVSGSAGTFAITLNKGRTWKLISVPGGSELDFRGLAWIGPRTTLLVSAGLGEEGKAKILRSVDAGATWTSAYSTNLKGAFLDGIVFWSPQRGLVMGDPVDGAWFLLSTTDGGSTWQRVTANMPALEPGEAAFAASDTALTACGDGCALIVSGGAKMGRTFASTDFGQNWTVTATPVAASESSGLFSALADGKDRIVAVGGDYKDELASKPNIAVTADGGASWTIASQTGDVRLLESVARIGGTNLIAVGPRGTSVSHDDGKTWAQVDKEAFHAISCTKGTCVAAGAKGHVGVWVN